MKDCRRCAHGDGNACALGYDFGTAADCSDFAVTARIPKPRASRERSPGRPPIEPNPPRTPEERVQRWRAMLAAFQDSTGIAIGTPPTFLYLEERSEYSIPAIGWLEPDWHGVPDWIVDTERWSGRNPALLAVLQSEAFHQAARKLPLQGSGVPRYPDLKAAREAWQALRATARKVTECREEIDGRHLAGKGLHDCRMESKDARTRWASAWLPVPEYLHHAAKVLADAEVPFGKTSGRPKEGTRDALREIVSVLSRVRCPDGRKLTTPELTWLLMLAFPRRFLYGDELHLRERVQKAWDPLASVRTKPRL